MTQAQVPLTPAERMLRIREAVKSAESPDQAYAMLAAYFSRLDLLRDHMTDLEDKILLQEQPFVSNVPLVGWLIARFRTLWNWVSTKWYVLPLIQQQNEINTAMYQTHREILVALESLSQLIQETQIRVDKLEMQNLSLSQKEQE